MKRNRHSALRDRLFGRSTMGVRVTVGAIVTLIACTVLVVCTALPQPAVAASTPEVSPTLASFQQAEAMVLRALDALGGFEHLEAAGGLTLAGSGTLDLTTMMQGTDPEQPDLVPIEESLALDLVGERVGYEVHGRVNPDADEWIRYVYDAEGRLLIVLRFGRQAFWVPGDDDHRRRYQRIVPHLLLRDALEQRQTLRALDRTGEFEAASFTLDTGEAITLLFDRATGHLAGFEYLLDLPLRGDTAVRWELGPYLEVDGLGSYPHAYQIYVGDRLLKDVRYEVVRAGIEEAAVFEAPEGVTIPEPPPPPAASNAATSAADTEDDSTDEVPDLPEVRTLGDGVHVALNVRGGFDVLFVELGDSVLVVDTPAGYHELQMVPAIDWAGDVTSSSVGRRLLAAIRATVSDKPVRHVVLTHHHGDHIGGIRPFLAAGSTVYASAPTAGTVERAARATFRLEPDELSMRPMTDPQLASQIEIIDGERTISGGGRSVRIIPVGNNPHAEGVLLVYLPQERILYQSDLFMPWRGDAPDPARVPVMRWFVDWLDGSGLEPETILAIHGLGPVSEEQLETIRALGD